MAWGGARAGAGRPKSEIPKKYRGIRLTDDEWAFVKEAVKKYRNGEKDVANDAVVTEIPVMSQQKSSSLIYQEESGASLLAHLESLYQQRYYWMKEYEAYLQDESYDKYKVEEIKIQGELLGLQIVTLIPHLNRLVFNDKVKMSWAHNDVAAAISTSKIPEIGKDIVIEAWNEPRDLDYSKTNLRLRQIYDKLGALHEKVRRLKVKLDNY